MVQAVTDIAHFLRQSSFTSQYGAHSHVLMNLPRNGRFILSRESQKQLQRLLSEWLPHLHTSLRSLFAHEASQTHPPWRGEWGVEDVWVAEDPDVVYTPDVLSRCWDHRVANAENVLQPFLCAWLGLAECVRGNKPFVMDVDLKYGIPVDTSLFYTRSDVEQLVHLVQQFLKQFIIGRDREDSVSTREQHVRYIQTLLGLAFNDDSYENIFTIVVLEKPPYVTENGLHVKRGLHLHAPYLFFNAVELDKLLMPQWLTFICNHHGGALERMVHAYRQSHNDLQMTHEATFEGMFDVRGSATNWLMYGCTKSVFSLPYLATHAFNGTGERFRRIRDAFVREDGSWLVAWQELDGSPSFRVEDLDSWWQRLPTLLSFAPERLGMRCLHPRISDESNLLGTNTIQSQHDPATDMEEHEQTWDALHDIDYENGEMMPMMVVAESWITQIQRYHLEGIRNPTYAAFVSTYLERILDELVSPKYATYRSDWIRVGVILNQLLSENPDDAFELWQRFSNRTLRDNLATADCARQVWRWIQNRPAIGNPWSALFSCISQSGCETQLKAWYSQFKSDEQCALRCSVSHVLFARRLWQQNAVFQNVMMLGHKRYVFIPQQHCWIEDDHNIYMMQLIMRDNMFQSIFDEHLRRVQSLYRSHHEAEEDGEAAQFLKKHLMMWQKQRSRIENLDFIQKTLKSMDVLTSPRVHLLPTLKTELDSNPFLLCVRNGVLDLQTMELRPGKNSDMITIQIHFEYHEFDPDHPVASELLQLIQRTFTDDETRTIFLEHLARLLFGLNWHKKVYHWTGGGDGGKSVLQTMIETLFGNELCISRDSGLLTEKMGTTGGATPHIVDIFNKRAVFMYEPDNDVFYKNGSLKMLSGGDRIRGRGLYENKYTSKTITFTPIVVCNDIPRLKADDYASWERIAIFPFLSRFKQDGVPSTTADQFQQRIFARDASLGCRVLEFAPHLLSLLVRVLREGRWKAFRESEEMKQARRQYERNNDVVSLMLRAKVRITDRPNAPPDENAIRHSQIVSFEMLRSMYAAFQTKYRYGRNSSLSDTQLLQVLTEYIGSAPHTPQCVWYHLEIIDNEFFT